MPTFLRMLLTALGLSIAATGTGAQQAITCLIEPDAVVRVSTAVEGIIEDITVDRGDTVKAGTVLARLDSRVEEAAVALAQLRAENAFAVQSGEARLRFLERQAERMQRLSDRNAVSDAQLEEVLSEAEMARQDLGNARHAQAQARLELAEAQARLARRRIASPTDGVVVERLLSIGEYRDDQSHILTIARLDPLRVEVLLPIELYGQIAVGDSATVIPEAPIGGRHTARVTVVDRVLDAATATFGIRLELRNPDLSVPAGLRCEIELPAGQAASR